MPTLTMDDLIAREQAALDGLVAQRQAHTETIADVRSLCSEQTREPSADEAQRVLDARTKRSELDTQISAAEKRVAELRAEKAEDERIDGLASQRSETDAGRRLRKDVANGKQDHERRVGGGVVGREERTYNPESAQRGVSWVQDAFRAATRNEPGAQARLNRHAEEVRVEGQLTERAASTGSFAGLIPPQYLIDKYAQLARAGRPFANCVQSLPLPSEGMSFKIPRGTTGVSSSSQATENSSLSNTDPVDADLTISVVTIGGYTVVSRQAIERGTPGIDELIFADGIASYMAELGRQVLAGSGASNQMLGVLNTSGIAQATAFTAAATGQTAYSKTAGALNSVETLRYLAPSLIAMHPRRWNWWLTQFDTAGRPYVVPSMNGPFNGLGVASEPVDTNSASPVGTMLGLPVVTDPNVPTAVGTGPEDQIIVCRAADLLLWEDGDGTPTQLTFEQPAGTQLGVQLAWYGYAAFTAGRYPTAVAVVGGNAGTAGFGLVAPAF